MNSLRSHTVVVMAGIVNFKAEEWMKAQGWQKRLDWDYVGSFSYSNDRSYCNYWFYDPQKAMLAKLVWGA